MLILEILKYFYHAFRLTKPEDFHPPYPVSQDTDIIYQAFDDAGNMAECPVRLRIPG